ncbi:DNA polymerase III subunit beta [Streptomyces virginiae]|uniref:DNA polymerase III subunit beta n=1 Tax=Streptomyces virginiae TaxID=1961 RepID=A0A0L8ML79_STRVG|nr:MerR family transcriptional regulator [Streptomyces virginiae]KOG51151.1 DNA polymerase III subunit beta [Streptomyces virginiae]
MHSIGEMGRDSGLGVSALRFYDRAGVLVPARVDPVTGYRWYTPEQLDEARLLARLRQAGMPLADVRLVLAGWAGADTGDTALVPRLLDGHLRRLERELADARGALSTVRALLGHKESTMTTTATPTPTARLTVPAAEFAAALDSVRFAVGNDPELPMLGGVHFDVDGADLHLVATDRYRMAVACASTGGHGGERVRLTVPAPLVDAMRALLADGCEAVITVDGDAVELETQGRRVAGQGLGEEFPDYRRLTRLPEGRRIPLDVPALRQALAGQDGERCALVLTDTVTVAADDAVDFDAAGDRVGVNPAFLLEALAAGEEMLLEYVGPRAPLVLLRPDTEDAFSLLMPCTLDA